MSKNLDKAIRASLSRIEGHKRVTLFDLGYFINFKESWFDGTETNSNHCIEIRLIAPKADDYFTDAYIRIINNWAENDCAGYCHLSESRFTRTVNFIRLRFYSRYYRDQARKRLVELAVLAKLETE